MKIKLIEEKETDQRMIDYEEATSKYSEDDDCNEYLDSLFTIFVPDRDTADTFGGELVRAIGRLNYRFYNDGDMFNHGCDSSAENAAAYIYDVCTDGTTSKLSDIIEDIADTYDEVDYEKGLKKLIFYACGIFADNPELFKKKNDDDFLNHNLPEELTSLEDVDLYYDEFYEYKDGIEEGYIYEDWVDNFMEDFEYDLRYRFGELKHAEIEESRGWRNSYYTIKDVPSYLVDDVVDYFENSFKSACEEAREEWEENSED